MEPNTTALTGVIAAIAALSPLQASKGYGQDHADVRQGHAVAMGQGSSSPPV